MLVLQHHANRCIPNLSAKDALFTILSFQILSNHSLPNLFTIQLFQHTAPPALQFDLIEDIKQRTGVPLSLHGGTGIPLADVRRAGKLGMRKMNVATQIHKSYGEALGETPLGDTNRQYNWLAMQEAGRQAITDKVAWYIRECGTEGLLT